MEATAQSSNREECETSQTPRSKVNKRKKEGEEGRQCGSVSTVPRTRSQVAPDWTAKEELILVNEIAAVESDCLKALSSYQKWKIIVQNCTALDVCRPLNQCRKKWDSLLLHYKQIKIWDSDSTAHPYSSLPSETRKQCGLPLNFDQELFKAIDDYVQGQNEHLDTDLDTDTEGDPEGEADMLRLIAKLGASSDLEGKKTKERGIKGRRGGKERMEIWVLGWSKIPFPTTESDVLRMSLKEEEGR